MSEDDDRTNRRIGRKQTLRIVLLVAVAVVLALWAFANTDDVEVDWLLTTTTGPLVLVIAISAALGFLLGAVATWHQGR